MQKFRFAAERLLKWRRIELQLAESALEQAIAEARLAELGLSRTKASEAQLETFLVGERSFSSLELSLIASARTRLANEVRNAANQVNAVAAKATQLSSHVTGAKTRVKALERLRETRHYAWELEADKEVAIMAEESHRALRLRNERS